MSSSGHDEWEEVPEPHADEWEEVPAETAAAAPPPPVSGAKAFLSHALDMATFGNAQRIAAGQDASRALLGDHTDGAAKVQEAMDEGAQQNPWSAAAGDAAGFLVGTPGMAMERGLSLAGRVGQAASKLPVIGKVAPFLARGLAGAGVGGGTSGLTALGHGASAGEAWDAAKEGAQFGGAATAAPLATAGYLGAKFAAENDPVKAAQYGTNAALLGLGGAASLADPIGRVVAKPGETARSGIAADLAKKLLRDETKTTRADNATGARNAKEYFRRVQGATEPVGGGPRVGPSGAAPEDLHAQAVGKLGKEIQENFAFLRSKDPLGLKLTPDAVTGAGNILPDYEGTANTELSKYAKGKDARLQEIIASLSAPADSKAAPRPTPADPYFLRPELLPTSGSLRPNPLAGFTPQPLPTPESVLPKAQAQVPAALAQMKAERGVGARLLGGTIKGATGPVGAIMGGGGVVSGNALPGIASAGTYGALKALGTDPVLATSVLEPVGKALQASGKLAKRVTPFLAGATGPLLTKKIEFLMQTDPEFRAAVEAQHGP
jgi:hypothetical protein